MQELDITNIGTWVHDMSGCNKIFRFLVYKKVYTPYEQENKFSDESEYENGGYWKFGLITNAIEIPNDVLLEIEEMTQYDEFKPFEPLNRKVYFKLSDIRLEYWEDDNQDFNKNEEE